MSSACSTHAANSSDVESGHCQVVRVRPLPGGMRPREYTTARPSLCAVGKVQFDIRYARSGWSRRWDHFHVHRPWGPRSDRAMLCRSRPHGTASARARGLSSCWRPVIDQRGRLLRATVRSRVPRMTPEHFLRRFEPRALPLLHRATLHPLVPGYSRCIPDRQLHCPKIHPSSTPI